MTTPDLAAIEARWAAALDDRIEAWNLKAPQMGGHPSERYEAQRRFETWCKARAIPDMKALIAALRASEEARGRLEAVVDAALIAQRPQYDATRRIYICRQCRTPGDEDGYPSQIVHADDCWQGQARRALQGEEAGNG